MALEKRRQLGAREAGARIVNARDLTGLEAAGPNGNRGCRCARRARAPLLRAWPYARDQIGEIRATQGRRDTRALQSSQDQPRSDRGAESGVAHRIKKS